jgi:IclR family transcriptional regulator, KDG regulon repressor
MSERLIQSVERAMDILELFLTSSPELSVKEISEKMRLSKSTVHGFIKTLEHRGYLDQNPVDLKYRLGMRLFELGNEVSNNLDIKKIAQPIIRELVAKINETVHLAVLSGDEVIYTEKVEGPGALRMYSQVGKRVLIHCTGVGKAILAFLEDQEIDRILAKASLESFTQFTLTNKEDIKEHLKVIRLQGYAEDKEEIELGLRCVAVPIFDYQGKVIASLSCAGPTMRLSDARLDDVIQDLKNAALEISRLMGYRSTVG